MATLILDTECYRNYFYLGVKRIEDGRRVGFEFSKRGKDFDRDRVRYFLRNNTSIGFNSITYDLPMIYLALDGASNEELKEASDRIIIGRLPYWEAEKALGVKIPKIDHIDLMDTNPSVKDSLKSLMGRMHCRRMQDLPFDPTKELTDEEIEITNDYCLHSDLDGTHFLYDLLREPIMLREEMGKRYNQDFRSRSDAQMGERIIRTKVEDALGKRVYKADFKPGTSFSYEAPDWLKFETPELQSVLERATSAQLTLSKDGKILKPKSFSEFKVPFGASTYSIGIGGIHSTEANRHIASDDEYVLIDADVASQYPSIIMERGLYPEALGKDFLKVYQELLDQRLRAKKAKDKITDKGLKISINGAYGKLGSKYSVLFAPKLLTTVTLTGQLSILMLIERAEREGIQVVSGNTDGVVFRCPRKWFDGIEDDALLGNSKLKQVTDWWMETTGFKLEFTEYSEMYNQSVNFYMALKPGGGFKRKGNIANHWIEKLPWGDDNTDYDPVRSGLMKNPQMTIIADAVLGFISKGIPIEETIYGCKDPRQFVTVIKATGGATWREQYLGKVVRFYWSTDGEPLVKVKAHETTGNRPKVPKTDGARPLMDLPDEMPADVDYARYVDAAWKLLYDLGYHDTAPQTSPLAHMFNTVLNRTENVEARA